MSFPSNSRKAPYSLVTNDLYAVYVRETLALDLATHYLGYQPSRVKNTKQMGELVFRDLAAANATLAVLKLEEIVTKQNKRTFINTRGEFTIALDKGEAMRLREQAARLAPTSKHQSPKTVSVKPRAVPAARKIRIKPELKTKPISKTKPIIPTKKPASNPNANHVKALRSYRRRLFYWLGNDKIAFVRHPIMLVVAVASMGCLYALGFACTAITAALVSYAALFALSRFSTKVNEQAALLTKVEPAASYELGEHSTHWAPYLQSFVQPRAYSSAYQVGLMNAQEEAYISKKRCAW